MMFLKGWQPRLTVALFLILSLTLMGMEVDAKRRGGKGRKSPRGRHFIGLSQAYDYQEQNNHGSGHRHSPGHGHKGHQHSPGHRQGTPHSDNGKEEIEQNLTALWNEVHHLSHPIHIHFDGGHSDTGHGHEHSPSHHGHNNHSHSPTGKHQSHHGNHQGGAEKSHGHQSTHIHVHLTLDKEDHSHAHHKPSNEYVYAKCDLVPNNHGSLLSGRILMRQKPNEPIEVKVNITGVEVPVQTSDQTSKHGLHVHEFADFSHSCASFGGHFNPHNTSHGHGDGEESHMGDWGNIECNSNGNCVAAFNVTTSTFFTHPCLIGRGMVFHAMEDDNGTGGNAGSLATGNAGKRLACGAIVWTSAFSDDEW